MSSAPSAEFGSATIIRNIETGTIPREAVLSLARGFLPLERDDLIAVLAWLASNCDEEVAGLARTSLQEIPSRFVHGVASDESAPEELLRNLGAATEDRFVLEALIRNRSYPDDAVASVARSAEPSIQEIIVINQSRILRRPEILDALLENPNVSADVRRRALETREEFFDKKARAQPVEIGVEPDLVDEPIEPIVDLLAAAASATDEPPTLPPITEVEKREPETTALFARILKMTVAQRVLLAFRGDRTARLILVRERNRLVCSAAMRNPRITETEVEIISGLRNVDEEVLRIIGTRREWTAKYNIGIALCRNPRAPIGVVLPLINRLTLRDLKGLKDDKGVSEVVRSTARRAFIARTKKS